MRFSYHNIRLFYETILLFATYLLKIAQSRMESMGTVPVAPAGVVKLADTHGLEPCA